jgi:hypothetical protein
MQRGEQESTYAASVESRRREEVGARARDMDVRCAGTSQEQRDRA